MTQRYAVKFAYLGTRYKGFQRQKSPIHTVEGKILEVLTKLEIIKSPQEAKYSAAGRTDTGVHALTQVITFDSLREPIYLEEINQLLPEDIYAWGKTKVNDEFSARRQATKRTYRYYITYSKENIGLMRKSLKKMLGDHDFARLCKKPSTLPSGQPKSTKLTLEAAKVKLLRKNNLLEFEFKSRSFLWHQVRKMVTLVLAIGKGDYPVQVVENFLDPQAEQIKLTMKLAPPDGLVLFDVEYPGITFEPMKKTMKVEQMLLRKMNSHASTVEVMKSMKKAFL
ncbi:MAG: tRNA pseudouridine(38-40) synthase TruA [Candidatus Heimdallarchaeota archaeon]